MSTNDTPVEEKTEAPVESPDNTNAEDELRQAKAEIKPEAPEPVEADKPAEPEAEAKAEAPLTTEIPTEPQHDLDWYKKAYDQSTKEALRLKAELDKKPEPTPEAPTESLTPEQLYIRQKQSEEISEAFTEVKGKYTQLDDAETYKAFVAKANILGRLTYETEQRVPTPKELYYQTVAVLGLTPDNTEAIGAAVKDSASSPRTSGVATAPPKSKVSEDMIALNQKMYPNKSREEIIKELEPHIN
jgi:hypothetical protein